MIDYNNPNDPWTRAHYDPYAELNQEQRERAGCLEVALCILSFIGALIICALMGSCTTERQVTVPETHIEHHWHTDTLLQHDSIHNEHTTVVRELDSAQMAEYGIRLKEAERAWLVESSQLRYMLSQLQHRAEIHDTVRDTIANLYPVDRVVQAQLSGWQHFLMWTGVIALIVLICFIAFKFLW